MSSQQVRKSRQPRQLPYRAVTECPICSGTWTSAGGTDKGNRSRHESSIKHQNAVRQQQLDEVPEVQAQEVQVQEVVVVPVVPVVPVQEEEVQVQVVAPIMAYPNQIAAAQNIINLFNDDECHWAVLLAFPQSGKTQTFYYVACDMLCNRPDIDRAIVVCGNAENELSDQLRASKTEFIRLYVQAQQLSAGSEEIIAKLEEKIQVWCGADLKRNSTHPTSARNTLFIWEEAHYAQNKTNRPHKFFKNLCITADGEISNLEGERNNYVLTVSATPFSELSNIWHHGQKKRVVRLEPAQGYKGPRHFLAAGAIVQFDPLLSCEEVVAQAIAEAPIAEAPKYAIVRVRDYKGKDNMAACIRVAVEHGWAYRVYDSETKYHQANSMQSMDELAVVPERNTLILIRGMCRMGKRVPKDHISFVIETSKDSDTDTVLQALLGRMFGYHDNMNIRVYLSRNIHLAEIVSYVCMMENPDDVPLQTMPRRGKNLIVGSNQSVNGWFNNVPIIVRAGAADADDEEHADDPNAAEYEKELTIRAIQAAFETGAIENHNCADQTAEIRQQILQLTAEPDRMSAKNFMNRRGNRINETYKDMPDKLRDSIAQRSPLNAGSAGCGFESNEVDGMQVNVWRCNTNQFSQSHGFYPGDLIVHTRTRDPSPQQQLHVRIPCTSGLETFCTQQEDGAVVIGNGGYSIPLAVETSHDAALMQMNLCDLIRESQIEDSLQRPKCVTSNHGGVHAAHDGVSDWKGIIVTVEIMQALQRGGAIYEYIRREHGMTLKITKALGRELKSLKNMGNARLTKIEWS
jgi:hypothetical protein